MYTIKLQIIDNFNKKLQILYNINLVQVWKHIKGFGNFGQEYPPPLYLIHSILKQAGALAFIFNHDMH